MRIALYGGSFNPPHLGHAAAARTVYNRLGPDIFLIIPDHVPPHKELAAGSPTAEQRLALCKLAFRDIPGAQVSDLELRREGRSYTWETVRLLRERYPEDELYLVMGGDMLLCFDQWVRFDYLLSQCTLAVLTRETGEGETLRRCAASLKERFGARVLLLPHEPLPMSSRELRALLPERQGAALLNGAVYAEIIRARLYGARPELPWLREQAYAFLKPSRVPHVEGCEVEAVQLSRRWGEEEDLAAEAAILHDITKKFPFAEQLHLCDKYGIINDRAELENPAILHAKTGAAMARALFGVEERVYRAIRWHCTGKPDMTVLEKIVWLADYIEPTRSFPGVETVRALAYESLDAAMAKALEQTLTHIRAGGKEPYKDTEAAYQWYSRAEIRRQNHAQSR